LFDLNEVRQAWAKAIIKENMLQAVLKAIPRCFFLMEEPLNSALK
jgi:hypothetical protein